MNRNAPGSTNGERVIWPDLNYSMDSPVEKNKSNYFPFALIRREKVELGIALSGDPNYPDEYIVNKLTHYFTDKFLTEKRECE